jgi:hypothetical protein
LKASCQLDRLTECQVRYSLLIMSFAHLLFQNQVPSQTLARSCRRLPAAQPLALFTLFTFFLFLFPRKRGPFLFLDILERRAHRHMQVMRFTPGVKPGALGQTCLPLREDLYVVLSRPPIAPMFRLTRVWP